MGIRQDFGQPFAEGSDLSVLSQDRVGRVCPTFLFLKLILGKDPIPGITNDGKLKVFLEGAWLQLFRVAEEILMILPAHPEELQDALAGCLRDVNEDEPS